MWCVDPFKWGRRCYRSYLYQSFMGFPDDENQEDDQELFTNDIGQEVISLNALIGLTVEQL